MGGAVTKAEFEKKNVEAMDRAEKKFLGDMRDHNSMSVTDCTPTITPPSSPFRKRRDYNQAESSNIDDFDSPLEIESLAGESPPSSPEPTHAIHPYEEEDDHDFDIEGEPIDKIAIQDQGNKTPNSKNKLDDMAVMSFMTNMTAQSNESAADDTSDFFSFSTPPSGAKLPTKQPLSSSPRNSNESSYMKAMIDLISPRKKHSIQEPIPFKLDGLQEDAGAVVESLMAEDVEEIDPPHKIEKNNVVVDKLGAKSISELTSIEHGREGHDTWRTKSLIRPDSFSGEFIQEMEAGDEALRQQRVSAALENMQLEQDVQALRTQLGMETEAVISQVKSQASPRWSSVRAPLPTTSHVGPSLNYLPPTDRRVNSSLVYPSSHLSSPTLAPGDVRVSSPRANGPNRSSSHGVRQEPISPRRTHEQRSPALSPGSMRTNKVKSEPVAPNSSSSINSSDKSPRHRRRHRRRQQREEEQRKHSGDQSSLSPHRALSEQQQYNSQQHHHHQHQQQQHNSQQQQHHQNSQQQQHHQNSQQQQHHQNSQQHQQQHNSQQQHHQNSQISSQHSDGRQQNKGQSFSQQHLQKQQQQHVDHQSGQSSHQSQPPRPSRLYQLQQKKKLEMERRAKEEESALRQSETVEFGRPTPILTGKAANELGEASSDRPWSASMRVRSCEVELMLRRTVDNNEDINYTLASAEAGLMFMDRIDATAKRLGVLTGVLCRWILPYASSNQSVADQKSRPKEVLENVPPEFRNRLSEKEIGYLVRGANSVRKLIRIKIADDNDLNQARESLKIIAQFYRRVSEEAKCSGMDPINLVRLHRESPRAMRS